MCIRDSPDVPPMGDEDIFHSLEPPERPTKSEAARQWFSSVGTMFTKCVPLDKIKAQFNKSRERSQDDDEEVYHQFPDNSFPDMNSTGDSARPFQPAVIPEQQPSAKGAMPGDDEWAESLARRASSEIDRVREDTRRRSKTLPQRSGTASNYVLN
eukprot:TRINITY_DN5395_c0_g1_i3.p1 TRINITY_DN5395_c0_g1~~TRINITY_DN5395_c0_g1_i3.p1  ORF type:complete len:155 (+),score=25.85 TRINITY_DN5395_c0_g1_i3:109-573(+)